jgi:hypothetical protein
MSVAVYLTLHVHTEDTFLSASHVAGAPAKEKDAFKKSDEVIAVFGLADPTTSPTDPRHRILAIPAGWAAPSPIAGR